jgi:hypothetical protein
MSVGAQLMTEILKEALPEKKIQLVGTSIIVSDQEEPELVEARSKHVNSLLVNFPEEPLIVFPPWNFAKREQAMMRATRHHSHKEKESPAKENLEKSGLP